MRTNQTMFNAAAAPLKSLANLRVSGVLLQIPPQ